MSKCSNQGYFYIAGASDEFTKPSQVFLEGSFDLDKSGSKSKPSSPKAVELTDKEIMEISIKKLQEKYNSLEDPNSREGKRIKSNISSIRKNIEQPLISNKQSETEKVEEIKSKKKTLFDILSDQDPILKRFGDLSPEKPSVTPRPSNKDCPEPSQPLYFAKKSLPDPPCDLDTDDFGMLFSFIIFILRFYQSHSGIRFLDDQLSNVNFVRIELKM